MEVGTRVKIVRCHLADLNGLRGTIEEVEDGAILNIGVAIDGDGYTTPFSESELELIETVTTN